MKNAENQREILAENIRKLLLRKDRTQTDMARDLDLAETTVSSWLNAKKYPRIDKIQMMADYFNVPRSRITESVPKNAKPVMLTIKIPVLGRIACGDPILAEENIEEYKERNAEDLPSGDLFYLIAQGNSMSPSIANGSLVLCRAQEDVENGEIAAVLVNGDEEATLKKVTKQGNVVLLQAINEAYSPYIVTEDNPARIVGKAVEVTTKL